MSCVITEENGIQHVVGYNYYSSDMPWYERYMIYENGFKAFHRLDGPAYINYDESGKIQLEQYFINGIKYSQSEWFQMIDKENQQKYLFNLINGNDNNNGATQ